MYGKSTIFNNLTGLHQHTGNWPGKTVSNASGTFSHHGKDFLLVDLPGTYSLMSNSQEEEIARDYICFGNPDVTVIVVDATCLERNLNLVYQTMEITNRIIVCVNLLDEAKKKQIHIDIKKLSNLLGVPVVGTSANKPKTLTRLLDIIDKTCRKGAASPKTVKYFPIIEDAIHMLSSGVEVLLPEQYHYLSRWVCLKLLDGEPCILDSLEKHFGILLQSNTLIQSKLEEIKKLFEKNDITEKNLKDKIVSSILFRAEDICNDVCVFENQDYASRDRKIDKILTSKKFGFPIMILFLGIIFWLTITGANYPSSLLSSFFGYVQEKLLVLFSILHAPDWLTGVLVLGMYQTVTWVISVMLPPMAIFFPLFTLLEDLGYLPRIAFNLDKYFKKACSSGKQALTMCMGITTWVFF